MQLVEKRKLRLVKVPGGKRAALDGVLEATVTNTGAAPVRLRDLEVHGVLFENRKGGQAHVVVHSCKCMKDVAEPDKAVATLAPGAQTRVLVDEWGCGGGAWEAPPPGSFEVTYRVVAAPAALPPPDPNASPMTVTRQCRESFVSPSYWSGAVSSPPLAVTLKAPVAAKR